MGDVHRFFADHDGVITAAQAHALGFTPGQIAQRVNTGRWYRIARGVFLSAEHHLTDRARVRIAVAQHHAVADRSAAAFWHGLIEELPPVVTVSALRTCHGKAQSPIATDIVRRSLPAEDVETAHDIRVTGRALTVLGAVGELTDGAALLDRALQTGAVTLRSLRTALDRNSGVHGLRPARDLIATLERGSESEGERLFARLLRLHRITGWAAQYPFGRRRLDFAWPERRVAVEIQGWSFHRSRGRFESDSDKAAALAAAGWRLLPFTWRALTSAPEDCIAHLVAALS